MPEQTKFRGIPIFFNGQEYVLPPLSIRQFRDNLQLLTEPIGEVTPENSLERMQKFVPLIGMALRRNYPEVTDDELLDFLDLRTFVEALIAAQTGGHIKTAKPGDSSPEVVQ